MEVEGVVKFISFKNEYGIVEEIKTGDNIYFKFSAVKESIPFNYGQLKLKCKKRGRSEGFYTDDIQFIN